MYPYPGPGFPFGVTNGFLLAYFRRGIAFLFLKTMLYDEQQQIIEDDLVPAGYFDIEEEPEVFVEGGDIWTVVDNTKVY